MTCQNFALTSSRGSKLRSKVTRISKFRFDLKWPQIPPKSSSDHAEWIGFVGSHSQKKTQSFSHLFCFSPQPSYRYYYWKLASYYCLICVFLFLFLCFTLQLPFFSFHIHLLYFFRATQGKPCIVFFTIPCVYFGVQ